MMKIATQTWERGFKFRRCQSPVSCSPLFLAENAPSEAHLTPPPAAILNRTVTLSEDASQFCQPSSFSEAARLPSSSAKGRRPAICSA